MAPDQTPEQNPAADREAIIAKISETLRRQRGAMGLSLDQVNHALKIRIQFLEALETGRWTELPGEVFVRGFLRRYAQHLGLDAEALLKPYLDLDGRELAPSEINPYYKRDRAPVQPAAGWWIWGGVALLLVIALGRMFMVNRPAPAPAPEPAAPAILAPVFSSGTTSVVPVAPARHELQVFSPYPLWLSVKASDKAFEGFIPQAATWTWHGEGQFNLRLGYSRNVALFFDGQPVALEAGQKKLTLPHEN